MTPQERVEGVREIALAAIAFWERSKDAHMITCDVASGMPLFAHWIERSRWRHIPDKVLICWCGEPTPETRRKAETVTMQRERDIYEQGRCDGWAACEKDVQNRRYDE